MFKGSINNTSSRVDYPARRNIAPPSSNNIRANPHFN